MYQIKQKSSNSLYFIYLKPIQLFNFLQNFKLIQFLKEYENNITFYN